MLFLRDCVQSCGAFSALEAGNCSRSDVEMRWKQMQSALHEVAVRHFAMRPTQRATKLLPQTFDLLCERRDAQQRLLEHADCWSNHMLVLRLPGALRLSDFQLTIVVLLALPRKPLKLTKRHGVPNLRPVCSVLLICVILVNLGRSAANWRGMGQARSMTVLCLLPGSSHVLNLSIPSRLLLPLLTTLALSNQRFPASKVKRCC